MRPIGHVLYQVVLDRIDMHVIHVRREIGLVPYQMLPVSALPDTALAPALEHNGAMLRHGQRLGKSRLDQAPAQREIVITLG